MQQNNNNLIPTYPTNEPNTPLIPITEFARLMQVSKDTLRRYERENLLTPIKKGIRGDRFYNQDHITIVNEIRKEKKKQYKKNALNMIKIRRQQIENRKRQLT